MQLQPQPESQPQPEPESQYQAQPEPQPQPQPQPQPELQYPEIENGSQIINPDPEPNSQQQDVIQGKVSDGYIAGATVFIDVNGNRAWDEGEAKTVTDENGDFQLIEGRGNLIATGGIDISTGLLFEGTFTAPEGSTVISPITTLVDQIVQNSNGNITVDDALSKVTKVFNIDPSVDLLNFDPIATANDLNSSSEVQKSALELQSLAVQIVNVVNQSATAISSLGVSDEKSAADAVFKSLSDSVISSSVIENGQLDLQSESTVGSVIKSSAEEVTSSVEKLSKIDNVSQALSASIVNVNTVMAETAAAQTEDGSASVLLAKLAQTQVVADAVKKDIVKAVETGDVSDLERSSDVVNLTTSIESVVIAEIIFGVADDLINSVEKSSVVYTVAGVASGTDVTVEFSDGSSVVSEVVAANGTYFIDLSSLSDGVITSSLFITDQLGNSTTVEGGVFVLDTSVPSAPTVALITDSGRDDSDLVTNNGAYTVSDLEVGAKVEYSADNTNWSSVELTPVEGENIVYVRQVDAAGNVSSVNNFSFTYDSFNPVFASAIATAAIDENSGAGQLVYTAVATDSGTVTYSLKAGDDAALFSIDANSGEVTLSVDPDYETQASYSFTVIATDAAGNSSEQSVTLAVNDLDEGAPQFTSGAIADAIDENSGTEQVIYTATATDSGTVTYSLKTGDDAALFSINANSGEVTLSSNPDYESKASYSFTVIATDDSNNSTEQTVTLNINDLDEGAPQFTSGATATAIDENSGAEQVIYTATATDSGTVTYSLKTGADAGLFSIDATSGEVTLTGNPDYEAKASYSFTVIATDDSNNSTEQTVTLNINDLDEGAPQFTSGAIADAIDENSGAEQVIYTATATDSGTVTYSLKTGADAGLFSIDANSGEVTLTGDPDYEAKASYSFTVIATDNAGNSSEQSITLAVNNLDENAPQFTSGAIATAIDENSGAGQLVYTATATDSGTVTYSLKAGDDAALFSIDANSGEVTLTGNPDYEAKASYSFTVIATDDAGNSSEQSVTLAVNNLDENAPQFTSGATATAIDENSGAGQLVKLFPNQTI
ncbi:cadherin repeat domain-containing protein [Ectothiorhodospiraceae bacterium BW-2]|nr:cadherin repeat domain-containing protein [Ectothiorhodospiraceae bacterium BW-2]